MRAILLLLFILNGFLFSSSFAVDFFLDFFANVTDGATDLILTNDAAVGDVGIGFWNESNQFSIGRAYYPTRLNMRPNATITSSFSTQFVFTGDSGFCFVLTNDTSPPGALGGQYFGLFTNATAPSVAPLLAVEFDMDQNPELDDPNDNHIGIDLNNIISATTASAVYYTNSSDPSNFRWLNMKTAWNIHAWIDFDGENIEINVTVAPFGSPKPVRPTLRFSDPVIASYVSSEMYAGFSASKSTLSEALAINAWSLSDTGVAREINVTRTTPAFVPYSYSFPALAIAGIVIGCFGFLVICLYGCYYFWRKNRLKRQEEEEMMEEDWELEYWPHRFSYEELSKATNGFSKADLLGSGGFGKVYKGILVSDNTEIAVKCVNHDSKQGVREFMAEIASMGRLKHKNLTQLRGWCRRNKELMLVYDYMPNGSLNTWIFNERDNVLDWKRRRLVLADVAEGLNYLHSGWDQVVVHRDIKSANVLLDSGMRGRLGDFGLAKLHKPGEKPSATRMVGTLGYMAPELARVASPTSPSDVYSFGVVILEVVCGKRPITRAAAVTGEGEEVVVLVDWVRKLYGQGRVCEAADERIREEYDKEDMELVLKLGLACCHPDPRRRPSMKEVAAVLVGEDKAAIVVSPTELLSELAGGVVENSI